MKFLCSLIAASLLAGCAGSHQHMGAANDRDQNAVADRATGGTTVQQLPDAVKQTLQQRLPHARVADVAKKNLNGQTVYEISFKEAGKNPKLFITENGKVLPDVDESQLQSK